MGPRLGPLVVTSVLARARDAGEGTKLATTKPKGALAKRIGDSKRLVAFDDNALGEAWARALARRAGLPHAPTPTSLIGAIALDADAELKAPCPSHHLDMCWSADGEVLSATEDDVATCMKDLDRLAEKGLDVMRVRVAIICTRRLNDAVHAGKSRFDVDLHTMERLTLAARADAGADVHALCGKVGGFDFYGDRFGPLAGRLYMPLVEGRARSDYHFPGVGRLSFLRDAEEGHMLVGLASLVGKWVRDLLMRRIVRYHRAHVPDLPEASGYFDPVSTKFVDATKLVRKKLKVADHCFERSSLSGASPRVPSGQAPPQPKPAKTRALRAAVAASVGAPDSPELLLTSSAVPKPKAQKTAPKSPKSPKPGRKPKAPSSSPLLRPS